MLRLGVFGDSWADINPAFTYSEEHNVFPWAVWLEKKLNVKLTSFANSSTGLWWSFDYFKKNYKRFEKIVFVYTEHSRWNGLEEHQRGLAYVRWPEQLQFVNKENKEYARQLIEVFPFLYNEDLNKFIYQHIFNEVNLLCEKFGIQLVNLMPFEQQSPIIDISKRTGPVLYNLRDVQNNEVESSPTLKQIFSKCYDVRHCHLNPINNKVLAEIIIENFGNSNTVMDLAKSKKFIYNDDEIKYFDKFWEKYEK